MIDLFERNRRGNNVADRIDISGDCWLWTGYVMKNGYGMVWWQGRDRRVHRVVWEALVGPIPHGLTLDHLCHNDAVKSGECTGGDSCLHRRCVNPDHIEPTDQTENVRRGMHNAFAYRKACSKGHEYTEASTYIRSDGRRQCRICVMYWSHEYRARKKASSCL